MTFLHKGDAIELEIDSLAFGGQGVGRYQDLVVFVNGTIPGQRVACQITQKKKNYAEAQVKQVIVQSPYYHPPLCKHFGDCGGCSQQNLEYPIQMREKESQVQELISRIGGFDSVEYLPIIASPDQYYYRNKMEFTFSRSKWFSSQELKNSSPLEPNGLFLGLHAKRFFEKVVDLEECHLCNPIAIQILKIIREIAKKSGLAAFTTSDYSGFWRFLVVRSSINTNDLMVSLISSQFNEEIMQLLSRILSQNIPQISTLYYGSTQSKANVAYCEKEYLLSGKGKIDEKIGPYYFEISHQSFFQTNTKAAQVLFDVISSYAMLKGNETVFDLYCGSGTISIYTSSKAKQIIGFETVHSAIQDALNNCRRNNITNCDFVLGDVRESLASTSEILSSYGRPEVIIIDPPRGGMHPHVISSILELGPERIVHVSCNPSTLARDLKLLCEKKYRLTKIQPVDMFPQTGHIEVVAQLLKK
jgi:23S rRNA (uracil1939-C5)-methyltransferase